MNKTKNKDFEFNKFDEWFIKQYGSIPYKNLSINELEEMMKSSEYIFKEMKKAFKLRLEYENNKITALKTWSASRTTK